jgi:hypothetical protein
VKIKNGASAEDMKIRLDVQKDSLLTKLYKTGPKAGRLPSAYAAKLDRARNFVGGCWRNIKTEDEP